MKQITVQKMLKSLSKELTKFSGDKKWKLRQKNQMFGIIFSKSVEKRLNRQIFDSWFRPIQFEGFDEDAKVLRLRASQS